MPRRQAALAGNPALLSKPNMVATLILLFYTATPSQISFPDQTVPPSNNAARSLVPRGFLKKAIKLSREVTRGLKAVTETVAIMLYVALKKSNPNRLHKSGQTTSAVFVKLEKKKLTRFTGKLQAGCPKRDTDSAVLCNHRDKMACICTMHQRNISMISNHATIHCRITIGCGWCRWCRKMRFVDKHLLGCMCRKMPFVDKHLLGLSFSTKPNTSIDKH